MREIKFRAWDEDEDVMYFSDDESTMKEYLPMKQFWWMVDKYGFQVEQYTGLKDKNGKEIYEGDKLSCSYEGENPEIRFVKWYGDNDYPAFDLSPDIDTDSNGLSYYMACGTLEIIGNIHESPEGPKGKEDG